MQADGASGRRTSAGSSRRDWDDTDHGADQRPRASIPSCAGSTAPPLSCCPRSRWARLPGHRRRPRLRLGLPGLDRAALARHVHDQLALAPVRQAPLRRPPTTRATTWLLALITIGEGWHNNHHHYQSSANQGFFWWEIDVTYYVLRAAGGGRAGLGPPPPRRARSSKRVASARRRGHTVAARVTTAARRPRPCCTAPA